MPLDVQPLSPHRQAAMLLLMLALLGGALGFAQILVTSRPIPQLPVALIPQSMFIIRAPQGFAQSDPEFEALQGAVLTGKGSIDGRERRFVVLSYPPDNPLDSTTLATEATQVFQTVMGSDLAGPIPIKDSRLGNLPAVALEGQFRVKGDASREAFLMERLTILPGKVLAICYSGSGVLTDADRMFFREFCETGVLIRPMASGTPKPPQGSR